MATVKEGDRRAERGQWTLKSKLLDPKTLNGMRLAAKKADMALGDWAATRLRWPTWAVRSGSRHRRRLRRGSRTSATPCSRPWRSGWRRSRPWSNG